MKLYLRYVLISAIAFVASFAAQQPAAATQMTLELRLTPPLERPMDKPSLCPMLALSLNDHWWVGAGYETLQDYDVILWASEFEGHKPIAMSGIRAGSWYRGGADKDGMTYSAGGLLTVASPAISSSSSPSAMTNDTWVVDFGADFTFGKIWRFFRLELFATPAWSYGRVVSPAIHESKTYSAFTYRVGVSLGTRFEL